MLAGRGTADSVEQTTAPDRVEPAVAEYQRALDRELEQLAASRASELKRLEAARSHRSQASASRDLSLTHRRAADSLAGTSAPAPFEKAKSTLVTALRRVAGAYRRVAAGAATQQRFAYSAGQTAVRRAETSLERALRAVRERFG